MKPTAPGATARAVGPGGSVIGSRDLDGFAVAAPAGRREVRAGRDVCGPLARVLSGAAVGGPASTVVREASGEGATVTVVLAEYPSGQAQEAMDAIGTALDTCASGFTATVDGEERKVGKAASELAPQGTDQAMALTATVERAGGKEPVQAVVLRSGDAVAFLSGTPTVPTAIVDAQSLKLTS